MKKTILFLLVVHPCLFSMDHNPHRHDSAVGYGSFQQIPDDVRIEISDADLLKCNERSPLLRVVKKDHERKRKIYSLLTSSFFMGSLTLLGIGIGFENVAYISIVSMLLCSCAGSYFGGKMQAEAHRANYLTPPIWRTDQQTAHSAGTVFQHVPSLKKLSFDVASRNIGAYSLDEIRLLSVAPEVKASLEKLHGRYIKLLETSIPSRSPSPCFLDRIPDVNPNMI